MNHLRPINRKAAALAQARLDQPGAARVLMLVDTPYGCSTVFAPGWEVDSSGGTYGLCQPIERDLYDCYHSCYWPAQVPDSLTNFPSWTKTCGSPVQDWSQVDLVFP
ncbi:MAG: quinohemoprotein amine dehydrogenase [Planctomycetes bacterium]|nr:quinohemoprotein amine dehydrogenase [Planctomycetota bacterium]